MFRTAIALLAAVCILLIIITSFCGIFLDDGGSPREVDSLRGEPVELYGGGGLYRYDTVYKAVMFKGYDRANLFVSLPLILLSLVLYHRRSRAGTLLIAGIFFYLFYNYLIGVTGNAYNVLFLPWIMLFSSGLAGLAMVSVELARHTKLNDLKRAVPRMPFLVYCAAVVLFLVLNYLYEIIPAMVRGSPPAAVAIYTTHELAALDLGVAVPLYAASFVLLLQRNVWGSLMGAVLVIGSAVTFVSQVFFQVLYIFFYNRGEQADLVIVGVLAAVSISLSTAVLIPLLRK